MAALDNSERLSELVKDEGSTEMETHVEAELDALHDPLTEEEILEAAKVEQMAAQEELANAAKASGQEWAELCKELGKVTKASIGQLVPPLTMWGVKSASVVTVQAKQLWDHKGAPAVQAYYQKQLEAARQTEWGAKVEAEALKLQEKYNASQVKPAVDAVGAALTPALAAFGRFWEAHVAPHIVPRSKEAIAWTIEKAEPVANFLAVQSAKAAAVMAKFSIAQMRTFLVWLKVEWQERIGPKAEQAIEEGKVLAKERLAEVGQVFGMRAKEVGEVVAVKTKEITEITKAKIEEGQAGMTKLYEKFSPDKKRGLVSNENGGNNFNSNRRSEGIY